MAEPSKKIIKAASTQVHRPTNTEKFSLEKKLCSLYYFSPLLALKRKEKEKKLNKEV